MFLSNIRTTIITKTVSEKLIRGSIKIFEELKNNNCNGKGTDRTAYLLYCNEKWAKIYNDIQNNVALNDRNDKEKTKKRKKLLKDSVRACYLVQFENENEPQPSTKLPPTPTIYRIQRHFPIQKRSEPKPTPFGKT